MSSELIYIVIPAWNEEATIASVVESIATLGTVLVVDDASTDRTAERAKGAGAVVIRHDENRGYVGALDTGFKAAANSGANFILTYDADGQHDVENLKQAISSLKEGADLVAGIRSERPRLSEKLFALTFFWLYGVRDPLCGLKGYNTRIYRDAGFFDRCNSYGADLLRFACARRTEYRIETLPVSIHERSDVPRIGSLFQANVKIFKAMCRLYLSRA